MINSLSSLFRMTLLSIIILLISTSVSAQDLSDRPLQKLIDCPSAGGPEPGSYDFELRAYPNGGVLTGFTVGLFKRFGIGIYYGGTEIIGFNTPDWNQQPGVVAMFRLIDESIALPALSLGFTNQGYGAWMDSLDRYQYKAKGFYAALGKNFAIGPVGEFGGHFGVNMNPIEENNEALDFFVAIDYRMTNQIGLIMEYSLALDDRKCISLCGDRGYLNFCIRWTFAERLSIDLNLRDVLLNQDNPNLGREIRISYVENI